MKYRDSIHVKTLYLSATARHRVRQATGHRRVLLTWRGREPEDVLSTGKPHDSHIRGGSNVSRARPSHLISGGAYGGSS